MSADDGAATITVDGAKDGRGERQVDRRMLIDGGLVGAEHEQTFASFNPANGKIVGYAPNATVADAEKASLRVAVDSAMMSGTPRSWAQGRDQPSPSGGAGGVGGLRSASMRAALASFSAVMCAWR